MMSNLNPTLIPRPGHRSLILGGLVALLAGASFLEAQGVAPNERSRNGQYDSQPADGSPRLRTALPVLHAARIDGPEPVIDGRLNEAAWEHAAVATDFVQFEPHEGRPASQPTEARILYGDDALYVAIRAYDSAPDSIVGQLTRRDQKSYSDWVWVMVDSYHDRRTAFRFGVNPRGVKIDIYHYDDTREDVGWDALWDVATRIDEEGWTAEFRIPYSQLRFASAPVQTWGLNIIRDIARYNEVSTWAPLSRQDNAIVSRSGELRGLEGLQPPRRVEVRPYTLARIHRAPGDSENPFYSSTDLSAAIGADIKYGVTSNLTLDLTMNPDFGQVEADPGQVNLTAFETFLPERRPFFVEGANIFRMGLGVGDGDGENQMLFYSRRVGRAPQGSANPRGGFVDAAPQTRIIAAGKLSGKTANGWSIGILNAITNEESAQGISVGGERFEDPIEPLSSYSVARLQKDFREGRSAMGIIATATNRDGETADALLLRSSAYTGGVDVRHRFGGDDYSFSASLLGSHVRGSEDAILRTQRSPVRYYQRPDADHLELDPGLTSLDGWTSKVELHKTGGGSWRWAVASLVRSPGFEANDLGFMTEADFANVIGYLGYVQTRPGNIFRNWHVNASGWNGWNFGGDRIARVGNVNGSVQLLNNWSAHGGINRQAEGLSTGLLRGGPAFRQEAAVNGWGKISSDGRKNVQLSLTQSWSVRNDSDSWNYNLAPNLTWRPSGRTSISTGPFVSRNSNDRQWVSRVTAGGEPHYIFGRLEQTTVGLTVRTDYTFTSSLSLQLYAQPFMSSGAYGDFKRVANPRAGAYTDRFESLAATRDGSGYRADGEGGESLAWHNPDFNIKQFRSNMVLRWEYRPGSTLFAVWAQARDHFEPDGTFGVSDSMSDLFSQKPANTFMLKLNYTPGT